MGPGHAVEQLTQEGELPSLDNLIVTHKSSAGHRGARSSWGGELPSLDKEGWPRHQEDGPFPLKGADGVVRSAYNLIGGLNQPPRLRPLRRLRVIFLMGAATPPYPRRGVCLPFAFFSDNHWEPDLA